MVAVDGDVVGAIGVADAVRPEAAALVAALHRVGVTRVLMLTGDQARVAAAVAGTVGIADARSGLLPEQKLDVVEADGGSSGIQDRRQNIVIALLTVGTLLAGVLFGGVTMSIGMLVHEASVLIVIVNGMRLLRPARGNDRAVA